MSHNIFKNISIKEYNSYLFNSPIDQTRFLSQPSLNLVCNSTNKNSLSSPNLTLKFISQLSKLTQFRKLDNINSKKHNKNADMHPF
jgi:hypothetical protein